MRNRELLLSESWPLPDFFFKNILKVKTDLQDIPDHLIRMIRRSDEQSYIYLIDIIKSKRVENLSHHIKYSIATYCIIYLTGEIKKGHVDRGMEISNIALCEKKGGKSGHWIRKNHHGT